MSGLRRIPDIQERLDAWGLWLAGGGVMGGSSPLAVLMGSVAPSDGVPRSYVPVDEIECSITDDAVRALPRELRDAVTAWHGSESGTLELTAARLGIVKTTLWRRLALADVRLAQWLHDRLERTRSTRRDKVMRDKPDRA